MEALLKQSFRPEFLNRLDEIVFYKPLTKENITGIIDLLIDGSEPASGAPGDLCPAHRRGQG